MAKRAKKPIVPSYNAESCPRCGRSGASFHSSRQAPFFKVKSGELYEEYCDMCGYALTGEFTKSGFKQSFYCKGHGTIRYKKKASDPWSSIPFDQATSKTRATTQVRKFFEAHPALVKAAEKEAFFFNSLEGCLEEIPT